jgi:hypothetical protein
MMLVAGLRLKQSRSVDLLVAPDQSLEALGDFGAGLRRRLSGERLDVAFGRHPWAGGEVGHMRLLS